MIGRSSCCMHTGSILKLLGKKSGHFLLQSSGSKVLYSCSFLPFIISVFSALQHCFCISVTYGIQRNKLFTFFFTAFVQQWQKKKISHFLLAQNKELYLNKGNSIIFKSFLCLCMHMYIHLPACWYTHETFSYAQFVLIQRDYLPLYLQLIFLKYMEK